MQTSSGNILLIVSVFLLIFNVAPAAAVYLFGADRCKPGEHGLWIVGVLFTSWLGFVAFLVVTTLRPPQPGGNQPSTVSKALTDLQARNRRELARRRKPRQAG